MTREKDLSKNNNTSTVKKSEPWTDPKAKQITAHYAAVLGHLLQSKDVDIQKHVQALRQLDHQLYKMKLGIDLKIRVKNIEVQR